MPDIKRASKKKLVQTRALGRVLKKQRLELGRAAARQVIEENKPLSKLVPRKRKAAHVSGDGAQSGPAASRLAGEPPPVPRLVPRPVPVPRLAPVPSESPASAAGPTVDVAEAMQLLPNLDQISQDELAKLPAGVQPKTSGKGAKNYTISDANSDGIEMSCEVQLHNRCFRVGKCATVWPEAVSKCVKWQKQSPFQAWEEFKTLAQWPADD